MSPDQAAAVTRAIEAMADATRKFRRAMHLPAASTEVPGWVAALDRSQVELARLLGGPIV